MSAARRAGYSRIVGEFDRGDALFGGGAPPGGCSEDAFAHYCEAYWAIRRRRRSGESLAALFALLRCVYAGGFERVCGAPGAWEPLLPDAMPPVDVVAPLFAPSAAEGLELAARLFAPGPEEPRGDPLCETIVSAFRTVLLRAEDLQNDWARVFGGYMINLFGDAAVAARHRPALCRLMAQESAAGGPAGVAEKRARFIAVLILCDALDAWHRGTGLRYESADATNRLRDGYEHARLVRQVSALVAAWALVHFWARGASRSAALGRGIGDILGGVLGDVDAAALPGGLGGLCYSYRRALGGAECFAFLDT